MATRKTLHRYLPEDWQRSLTQLRHASNETRDASFQHRQETKHFRNETDNKIKWDYDDNTTRLQDRVYEISRVRNDLNYCLQQINMEISYLTNAKKTTEREVEAHLLPIEVSLECLALRERRRNGDLVKDDVENQLEEELKSLERSRVILEKLVLDSVNMLRTLNGSRQKLEADILDKTTALNIDSDQANLNENSSNISYKPDPLQALKDALSPAAWLEHSTLNMKDAQKFINESQQLRDSICVAIQKSRRDNEAQRRMTDFALRRRLHQEIRARDELDWEKNNLLEEIREQEAEIRNLENCLQHSSYPLKVAQTRLESRKWRENNDLVEDAPHEGLRVEVDHLRNSRNHLRSNLHSANECLNALQNKLRLVDADLMRKNLSVNLEQKTEGTRERLEKERLPTSLTEQNLIQTGSLRSYPTNILL
ncbi:UNVERIFIED_CONTAM: hypothetical protein RMT77_001275 [Armadillidium vulgare]